MSLIFGKGVTPKNGFAGFGHYRFGRLSGVSVAKTEYFKTLPANMPIFDKFDSALRWAKGFYPQWQSRLYQCPKT